MIRLLEVLQENARAKDYDRVYRREARDGLTRHPGQSFIDSVRRNHGGAIAAACRTYASLRKVGLLDNGVVEISYDDALVFPPARGFRFPPTILFGAALTDEIWSMARRWPDYLSLTGDPVLDHVDRQVTPDLLERWERFYGGAPSPVYSEVLVPQT